MDLRTRTRPAASPHRPVRAVLGVLVLVLALVGGGCGTDERADIEVVQDESASEPVTHEYVIPFGTSQRLAGGEQIAIVPQTLEVKVGDTIRIRNDDAWGSQVGIFHVGAGETVTMKFTTPGTLTGECDVHPSGQFTIEVSEA